MDLQGIKRLLSAKNPASVKVGMELAKNFHPHKVFLFGAGRCEVLYDLITYPPNEDNGWTSGLEFRHRYRADLTGVKEYDIPLTLRNIAMADHMMWDCQYMGSPEDLSNYPYQLLHKGEVLYIYDPAISYETDIDEHRITLNFKAKMKKFEKI